MKRILMYTNTLWINVVPTWKWCIIFNICGIFDTRYKANFFSKLKFYFLSRQNLNSYISPVNTGWTARGYGVTLKIVFLSSASVFAVLRKVKTNVVRLNIRWYCYKSFKRFVPIMLRLLLNRRRVHDDDDDSDAGRNISA